MKVINLFTKQAVFFTKEQQDGAKKIAAHLMQFKHSIDPDLTLAELTSVNDTLFFLANSVGLSLHELTGVPQTPELDAMLSELGFS